MNGEKVLLVEDDLFLRQLYTIVLQKAGYNLLVASDGEEGLLLGQNNTDAKLMLLDIMMPKMHGIEVLKRLKADSATKQIPVVLLTNLTEESVVEEAKRLGACGYMVKMRFTPPEMIEKVKEIIQSIAQDQQ